MSLFLLLIVLVLALLFAIWWKPSKPKAGQSASILSAIASPSDFASDRDAVLESEIAEIVSVIRQDEANRRRAAALERLAAIQASTKKTK